MSWSVESTRRFEREFKKLDKFTQRLIKGWIEKNLSHTQDPRQQGRALSASLASLWRYRVGNYRIICEIVDERLVILALSVGHRRQAYKQK